MGVAGFFLAAELHPDGPQVTITDGNSNCAESLKKNLELNAESLPHLNDKVTINQLIWSTELDVNQPMDKKFDFIFIADCLYFSNFHKELVHTLRSLMHE
eukprot:CAMPEP_0176346024 /NCGR_PEP_ID=MMETSP0126-20121128/5912_1 /TAXON_ID=141414 ORGANISM="Strombidinopsis acuminatum, Strain SPMC142" /NCGR_SAMPLE_ID=MMETSP0126 /ASSEMBLY_ACC=CAM_ASM_000229 /LENGTH=99 /DNA_ID=CAMNT_0017693323 /DNA_START=458 /DNA_END=757 /DNA_ORIENTATION=-